MPAISTQTVSGSSSFFSSIGMIIVYVVIGLIIFLIIAWIIYYQCTSLKEANNKVEIDEDLNITLDSSSYEEAVII